MALEATELATALTGALKDDTVRRALKDALPPQADPWRSVRHFLAGMVTFCAAIIVGALNALPDTLAEHNAAATLMLGRVLCWIAITALVATACGVRAQAGTIDYRTRLAKGDDYTKPGVDLAATMIIPMVPGTVAVLFIADYGWRLTG